jgi:hypothetical protein
MSQEKKKKQHPNSLKNLSTVGRQSDDYKPEYCQQLVDFMKKGYSLGSFGAEIGKTTQTLLNWCEKYPEFKEAHRLGKLSAMRFFETMLVNASMGIIPQQLKAMGSKKLDITAIIFALKTRFHQDYGEKQQIDHTSSDGSLTPTRIEIVAPKK